MKISVSAGHSKAAPGAHGLLDEVTITRQVKRALIGYLVGEGVTVEDCTAPDNSKNPLIYEIRAVNAFNPDLAISLHANAGGGTGCEAWYSHFSTAAKMHAAHFSHLCADALGIRNRGAKDDCTNRFGRLGFCRDTKPVAVLIELCFVDNKIDAAAFDADKAARAIARAAIGKEVGLSFNPYVVRVTADVLNVREKPTIDSRVTRKVHKKDAYTIVEESAGKGSVEGWGKLRSGAGWISLDFVERV